MVFVFLEFLNWCQGSLYVKNGFSVIVWLSGHFRRLGLWCLGSEKEFSRENLGKKLSRNILRFLYMSFGFSRNHPVLTKLVLPKCQAF